MIANTYTNAIRSIKTAILKSRYRAAALANREMLALYFSVGGYISANSREGTWGMNAIEVIARQLQKELPGLRGFSAANIKKMRLFYEAWASIIKSSVAMDDLASIGSTTDDRSLSMNDLQNDHAVKLTLNRSSSMNNLPKLFPEKEFCSLGFTQHCEIIYSVKGQDARLFYIQKCAAEFWSVEKLKYHLKSDLYGKQGKMASNFTKTLSDTDLRQRALLAFKDEYLLDFNHTLMKLRHENPSIGIILCKSQRKTTVEFAFRDTSKPMGVAIYRLASELPAQYRDILPDAQTLKALL
jgi:predicted nuclease of restriction endonuclease-like (RecB) superfamily